MNAITNLMETLKKKWEDRAYPDMIAIMKESHQYFRNIPTRERELILKVLLDGRRGLLSFIRDSVVGQTPASKDLEKVVIQIFQLLSFIICQFSDVYDPYITCTQDVCVLVLTIKASYFMKSEAAKTLINFIQTFKTKNLDFNETVKDWLKKLKFYNINERRLLLRVMSVVALHFPQTQIFVHRAKVILQQLMSDFYHTYRAPRAKGTYGLPVYIDSLSNLLYNFQPNTDEIGQQWGLDQLYRSLKELCCSDDTEIKEQFALAIVNLLAEHMAIFDEFIYKDYELWHTTFKSFVRMRLYGETSIKALKAYYRTMGLVLGRKNTENDKQVFLNLRDSFMKSLSDGRLGSIELRMTVYGFGQIIEPCKNYFAEAGVEEMFSLIAHRTIPLYAREDNETSRFQDIADQQEALSEIIRYFTNVTIDQIRALTTLCAILIKRFPELSAVDQSFATSSLNRTIINVRHTKETLYHDFITNLIYDGIVWSCSHMLYIDAELKRDVDKLQKCPISYKDYVPLWKGLLNPANYISRDQNSDANATTIQSVVDEIITTCIAMMNTLNLNIKPKENNVFSDVKLSQTVENESDFRIFLNMVDLYVDILESIEHFLWSNILQKFIYEIVKNSYKHPLISGFYKLANVVLIASGSFQTTDSDRLSDEMFNLILQYLWNTIEAVPRYPQELQISCLQLILNVPEIFVNRIVDRAVHAFKISFTIGLTNYEIATTALNALERWTKHLGNKCPKEFIGELVPCLELYLQSEESSIQLLNDIEESKTRLKKKVTLLDDEHTIEGFQRRILLFFGSVDSDVMLEFIHKKSLDTGATWSKKDLLKYPMPFPDVNLDVSFDSMLPRIIELTLNSGDPPTRLAASEVLHTIVAFMLGKSDSIQLITSDPDRFNSLYETLCPALLRLGCDSDNVITQLYHPLMMQLTHWLSSEHMVESRATTYLIESLFDGLVDETNSSLRDVAGIYLAEFVEWSLKPATDEMAVKSSKNVDLIVQRIMNFALDPSSSKRVAAAIAFNHLYKILRENDQIFDFSWFDILHAFVKSLDGCNDSRILDALRHVERVLLEKSQTANETNMSRQRYPEFSGARFQDAAKSILTQCGSLDRNCRKRCMKLFESISRAVDSSGSAKSVLSAYLKSNGLQGLNDIIFANLKEKFVTLTNEDLTMFLRTLDFYVWLIREKMIDKEILFSDFNPRRSFVFDCIENFVKIMIIEVTAEVDESFCLREFTILKNLRCETLLTLLDLIPAILDVRSEREDYIPDNVFNESLFLLIFICLTDPQRVGFDSGNLQFTEQLPLKLEAVLKSAMKLLPESSKISMKNVFAKEIQKFSIELFKFNNIVENKVASNDKCIKGLILLHHCEILKECTTGYDITENADKKIKQIFDILTTKDLGNNVCFYPKSEVKHYLQQLVELLLIEYDAKTIEVVISLLMNDTALYRSNMTTITHGEYFFSVFKNVIIRGCVRNVEKTLNILENLIQKRPDSVLRITEALVLYLHRHRSEYQNTLEKFANLIIDNFATFERAVNNLEHRRNVFLNMYAIVVRLKKTPLDVLTQRGDIYRWILKELVGCNRLLYKIRLLKHFLICMTNENADENAELTAILHNLKNDRSITCPLDPSDNKVASPETIDCFQTLMKLLTKTKSCDVFDAVMNFAAGAGKLLCEDKVNDYLKLYFDRIPSSNVLKSLELAYKRFINTTNTNDRFDILNYFLLPSFSYRNTETETFFERNIKEIYTIIMQTPTDNPVDRQQLFVSKIGCFNLIAIMFANIEKDRIDRKDSLITINTIGSSNSNDTFTKQIFASTLRVRVLKAIEGDDKEIVRSVHCAAYNCSIAILVNTAKDERSYLTVFGENRDKNQLIWENIVDINRKYELRQTSKEYPKQRKKLVNIRKSIKDKKSASEYHYSYVKSYDLATSTLSENMCAYDLNAVTTVPRNQESEVTEKMSLVFEVDDLNDHECMAPICGLLKHMLDNGISRPQDGQISVTLPKWMSCFRSSMRSEYANVRLFMLKIILNSQAVFRPYAEFLLEPIIYVICQFLKQGPLNYIITDALVMLLHWQDVSIPKTDGCKNLARSMFHHLVDKATIAPTKHIVKYNMNILEMIVNAWHDSLEIPKKLNPCSGPPDRLTVRLILIFLTNKMEKKILECTNIWEYLNNCLQDWKGEEETVLRCYEAVGLMMKYSETSDDFQEKKNTIMSTAREVFRAMQIVHPPRLVKCIHALCKANNDLSEELFPYLSSCQSKVERLHMVKCLEVFSLVIPKLSVEDVVKELSYMQFNGLLEKKVLTCEKVCLEIISQLVPILEPLNLIPLIELASGYSEHDVVEYREICYRIFKKLYEKYSKDKTQEGTQINKMMNVAKKILLLGLLDPATSMQEMAIDFWTNSASLRDKCSERLVDILDTYTTGVEKHFLQTTTLLLLELTKKSSNYENKMFAPLHDGNYLNHDISVSWNSRNFESRIPLFAPSLASKLNQRLTQYSYTMGSRTIDQQFHDDFMTRATDGSRYEETFLGEPSISHNSVNDLSDEGIFAVPKVPEPIKNKVSRRFLANGSDVNTMLQRKEAAAKFTQQEYRRENLARQRSNVKLYRKYRIGAFPDIEITHATVIEPMQALLKKDPTICKNLFVCIIRSLINKINELGSSEEYCKELSNKFIFMCSMKNRQKNCAIIPAIFEIMFNVNELEFSWEVITDVAKNDELFVQGALLLERSLTEYNEDLGPPAKKRRLENNDDNRKMHRWIELASFYESMNEVDVVLSIFRGDMFSEDLKAASVARAAAVWEKAEDSYRKAYAIESGVQIRRHCLEGMYECLSRLGKWNQLGNEIESEFNPDYKSLLDSEGQQTPQWLVPWIFRSQTQRTLDGKSTKTFLQGLSSCLNDISKWQRLKETFGDELAVIFSKDSPKISSDCLNASCEEIRKQWIQLSRQAGPFKSRAVVKLRGIHCIDSYLKFTESWDTAESKTAFLNSWQNNVPMIGDDLLLWDTQMTCRSYFLSNLIEKISGQNSQDNADLLNKLHCLRERETLKLAECALHQRNISVAKRYLLRGERTLEMCDKDLIIEFELNAIRFKLMKAEIQQNDIQLSLKYYEQTWVKSHDLLRKGNQSTYGFSTEIALRQIISRMASSLANISGNQPEFIEELTTKTSLVDDIFTNRIDFDNVTDSLRYYSFSNLKQCCSIASEVGDCYLRLSKYCYEQISTSGMDSELSREFVHSTLNAMRCGSEEATHYFPCLLRDDFLADEQSQEIFNVESSRVETWRFLIWQTQLLSHLGSSIGPLVLPIVKRMIEEYPNALVYSLRLTLDTNPKLRNDPSILPLTDLLDDRGEFNKFLEAIQYVVQPELYLDYYLKELVRNLSRGKFTVVDALIKQVYPANSENEYCTMQGEIYRKTIASYKQEIERIVEMPVEDIPPHVAGLLHRLRNSLKKRTDDNELKNYSPWLRDFLGRDIEVPGQYTGDKKPLPRYHANILKIESKVKVMQSSRKPIRITIVANDGRSYRFLVKFGEDLRLDQRVEQIFDVMNKTLKSDVACSQRRLSIDTYQVFPLSGSLGFIQWIDGTRTLKEYIQFSLEKNQTIRRIEIEYEDWIKKASPNNFTSKQYKESLLKYTASDVDAKMMEFINKTSYYSLKKTFVLLSPSMESFMTLRQNFISTYATMCIAQWILGVGDRHIGNTLISVQSGRSLGIDFGSAFGGGVDQSVPELMPFRLTAQILMLLKPFNENDLMGATMIHVLRALRNGKGPLLACLNVVAHEHLNWEEHINKLSQETQSEAVDVKWLPAKKVQIVSKKLDGGKPSSITLEQLKEQHSDMQYYHRYVDIVNGTDSDNKSKRSFMKEDNLSPEEQVECLIEQATDLNILGRTFVGWSPWL